MSEKEDEEARTGTERMGTGLHAFFLPFSLSSLSYSVHGVSLLLLLLLIPSLLLTLSLSLSRSTHSSLI